MADLSTRPTCPYCKSTRVVGNGRRKGSSLYKCRGCGRQFRSTGAIHGLRFPPELIGEALGMYYRGSSLEDVVAQLAGDREYAPLSRNTVSRWVRTYSVAAVRQVAGLKAQLGPFWVVVTLPTRVRGGGWWAWFVTDLSSDYLIACHLSVDRDVDVALEVLWKARSRAARIPVAIAYDADGPCREAVGHLFPHRVSIAWRRGPVVDTISETLSETLQRQAPRVRRFNDLERGLRYLEGWSVFYNHLGGHVSPEGRTPGETAGVDAPFSTWADVVRLGPPARLARR